MASPVMTPRPPRSIAGPIVLILLGILFLLGTMGVLHWHSLWIWFARYWPALLIVWGIIKLIEYELAKRSGLPSRGIGAGGVFLVLFIICFGLIATQIARVDWERFRNHVELGDNEDWNDWFGYSSYDYSDELNREMPPGSTLRINDERGTITVNIASGNTLKVSIRKKIRTENQQDADSYNTKTRPQITFADKVVTLNANTQGAGDKSVTTDMDVYVPRNTALVIASRRGNVTITGMGASVEINHHAGDISVTDHAGNVALTLESKSVRLAHVKGDVTLQGRADEVAVEDVDGAVRLNGEFQESIRLARVSRTVGFHSSRTDLEFARLDGQLDLDRDVLRANSLAGPTRLITRSKDITLDGLSGDLRLQDENGTVEVGLHKPGNIQIDNRKGDITVSVPPNTGVKVEARARGGEIQSDFSELKVNNGEDQSSASGSIGASGPRLVINNENGTIEIRRASSTAPATPPTPGKPAKTLPAPPAAPVESEN